MDERNIAQIAKEILDEYEDKSLPFCVQLAADKINCEYMDVISALTTHTDISGFKLVEK